MSNSPDIRADLVVVANRLPVRRKKGHNGDTWETSPGGLVSALLPILQRRRENGRRGAWIGWTGSRVRAFDAFDHGGVGNVPVNLSHADVADYYDGMANATLWPLYHDAVRAPRFKRRWWRSYERVNRAFAEAASGVAAPGGTVWVHDYHLHLVPRMLREHRPDLRIGYFLHIPFPGRRLFAQLPWRREILEGTLGADVVGLQTGLDAEGFALAAMRFAGTEREVSGCVGDGGHGLLHGDRRIEVDAFPISIDAGRVQRQAEQPATRARVERHRQRLGRRTVLLGVDRMDYTKGIPHRLRAFRELLRTGKASADEVVLVQSCVPTRDNVGDYESLRAEVEELVGQINGEFGSLGQSCVHYLRKNLAFDDLVALYRAADVALVTPLRDGMNLIAKEFVAARSDERGVLVLSEFAGAADGMGQALLTNPHDLDGMTAAIERALRMPADEVSRRMRALRGGVLGHDVYDWADGFLARLWAVPRQQRAVATSDEGPAANRGSSHDLLEPSPG